MLLFNSLYFICSCLLRKKIIRKQKNHAERPNVFLKNAGLNVLYLINQLQIHKRKILSK